MPSFYFIFFSRSHWVGDSGGVRSGVSGSSLQVGMLLYGWWGFCEGPAGVNLEGVGGPSLPHSEDAASEISGWERGALLGLGKL